MSATLRSALAAAVATALTLLPLVVAGTASAGTAPNLLDRNLGVVLPHPHIHNLFWDNTWDADNGTSRGTLLPNQSCRDFRLPLDQLDHHRVLRLRGRPARVRPSILRPVSAG